MLNPVTYSRKSIGAISLVGSLLMLTSCATKDPLTPFIYPNNQPQKRIYQPNVTPSPSQNNFRGMQCHDGECYWETETHVCVRRISTGHQRCYRKKRNGGIDLDIKPW